MLFPLKWSVSYYVISISWSNNCKTVLFTKRFPRILLTGKRFIVKNVRFYRVYIYRSNNFKGTIEKEMIRDFFARYENKTSEIGFSSQLTYTNFIYGSIFVWTFFSTPLQLIKLSQFLTKLFSNFIDRNIHFILLEILPAFYTFTKINPLNATPVIAI